MKRLKTIEFNAEIVSAQRNNEDGFYLIGLADSKTDCKDYVILQRPFQISEHESIIGTNGEYIEINSEEMSGFQYCKSAMLNKNLLTLEFDIPYCEFNKAIIRLDNAEIDNRFDEYIKIILTDKLTIEAQITGASTHVRI